jgi:hypothetical protein
MLGNSRVAAQLVGFRVVLSSIELLLLLSLLFLYNLVVEPNLVYLSVAQSSITATDANKLERLQQNFAALGCNLSFPLSVTVVLML